MKTILFFLLFSALGYAQIPTGYYNGTEGLTGYALKTKLHQIISTNVVSWNYSDLPSALAVINKDEYYDQDAKLIDLYSTFPQGGSTFKYTVEQLISTASAEGQGWNREHVMPQSTFYSDYPMYSDLFFIFPSDAYINQRRSNNPYGLVGKVGGTTANPYLFTNGTKIGSSLSPGYEGKTVLEPIDAFKGEIARMLLYFIVRYQGKLNFFKWNVAPNPLDGNEEQGFNDWYITQLVGWSNQFPPSPAEINRNNQIYNVQQNRNPFIDHPGYVNAIWDATKIVTIPDAPVNFIVTEAGAHFIRLTWNPSVSALGYKIFVNGTQTATTDANHYDLGALQPSTSYVVTISAYNDNYMQSTMSSLNASTLAADPYANDLMITKYIEGTDFNKALEITNNTGYDVDLKRYRLAIQGYNSETQTYYTTGSYELEGILPKGNKLVLINPNATLEGYDKSMADIKTNSNPLNFSGWQYLELNYDDTDASGNKYPKTIDAIGYFGLKGNEPTDYAKDVSLYRNASVKHPNYRFTTSEWTRYPADYFIGLGSPSLTTEEIDPIPRFTIYPNPALSTIFVKGKNLEKIRWAMILDMSGKMVRKLAQPFKNGNTQIRVDDLTPGIYLLQLEQQNLKFIKK